MTAEELAALPRGTGERYELIDGELRIMAPASFGHGVIAATVVAILRAFVFPRRLGFVCGAETGFRLQHNPDRVRAADAAFVARSRVPPRNQWDRYLDLAPDLAIEVVSPNDTWTDVTEKAIDWLGHGVRIVWVIDPASEMVWIWRSAAQIEQRRGEEDVDADLVLPGFRCKAADFFVEEA
jgi:Uma2 family endonuclease